MARTHRIAVVPGDGIGKETVPESLKVLDAAARRFGFGLESHPLRLVVRDLQADRRDDAGRRAGPAGANPIRSCWAPSAGRACRTMSRSGAC